MRTVLLPKPVPGTAQARVNAVEWNIDRINAPRVWSDFGDRGEGVVVGTIDSGAQFDHPELAASYRGRSPDGSVDHDYNWFDPRASAPARRRATTTATARTSWAPSPVRTASAWPRRVKWIAAKGCEVNTCSGAYPCWPPASGSLQPHRPERATRTRAPTWRPTSSTTPGAATASTPGLQGDRSTQGGGQASSPPSPAAPARPSCSRHQRLARLPYRDISYSAAGGTDSQQQACTPAPARARARTARSSRTSPRPASTCARRNPEQRLRQSTPGTSMASPHVTATVADLVGGWSCRATCRPPGRCWTVPPRTSTPTAAAPQPTTASGRGQARHLRRRDGRARGGLSSPFGAVAAGGEPRGRSVTLVVAPRAADPHGDHEVRTARTPSPPAARRLPAERGEVRLRAYRGGPSRSSPSRPRPLSVFAEPRSRRPPCPAR